MQTSIFYNIVLLATAAAASTASPPNEAAAALPTKGEKPLNSHGRRLFRRLHRHPNWQACMNDCRANWANDFVTDAALWAACQIHCLAQLA